MLERFDGRNIQITTEDGDVRAGEADAYSSGYGLHEFGRAEESLRIGDTHYFLSDLRRIELRSDLEKPFIDPRQFDGLMGALLEQPCWIVDILPEQVPKNAAGQYFSVERYYRQPARLKRLRRKQGEILLRLNCYEEMSVSFDSCESWETDPDPEAFITRLEGLSGNDFLRAVFPARSAMIDIEPTDTFMTVFDPEEQLLDKLRPLTAGEGLFLWRPPEDNHR